MLLRPLTLGAAAFGLLSLAAPLDGAAIARSAGAPPLRGLVNQAQGASCPRPKPQPQPSSAPSPTPATNTSGKGVAAWWGQAGTVSLDTVCADPSYTIVVLTFMNKFFASGGYPALDTAGLNSPSAAQSAAGATDLRDGTPIVPAIKACQAAGKKVFMSLGGATASSTLASDAQGAQLADTVWQLFLGGTAGNMSTLRPFGDVVLDGIDLDNESHQPGGYAGLVQGLRKNFATDASRSYQISAAPQCPRPDASLSDDVLAQCDIVWVQFYNNKQSQCDNGESGFVASVQQWSKAVGKAQLWIGAVGSAADVGNGGYLPADQMAAQLKQVQGLNLPNWGGVAFWSAESATKAGIQSAAKQAMAA